MATLQTVNIERGSVLIKSDLPINSSFIDGQIDEQGEEMDTAFNLEKSAVLVISIDSEYESTEMLTSQITLPDKGVNAIIINKNFIERYVARHPEKKEIAYGLGNDYLNAGICTHVEYSNLDDDESNDRFSLESWLCGQYSEEEMPTRFILYIYFAVNDLIPVFSYKGLISAMLRGNTKRKNVDKLYEQRGVKGNIIRTVLKKKISFSIVDVSGHFSKMSLKSAALSTGVEMTNKGEMDDFKENMSRPMLDHSLDLRLTFGRYCMGDTTALPEIYNIIVNNYNEVLNNSFGFPKNEQFTIESCPNTVGTVVALAFQKYLLLLGANQTKGINFFKWSLCKPGYLHHTSFFFEKAREFRKSLMNDPSLLYTDKNAKSHVSDYVYSYNALNLASVNALLVGGMHSMLFTSATVTGGRCINERYKIDY